MQVIFGHDNRYSFPLCDIINNRDSNMRRAVLLLRTFVGPCPPGMECCHTNGVSTDDRLSNLRWDTRANNALDKLRNNKKCGPKLSKDDVREIRQLREAGVTHVKLAKRFNVSRPTISRVCAGKSWKRVV